MLEKRVVQERVAKKTYFGLRSADDYEQYSDVLPSARTVNRFKHRKALSQEIAAALALHSKIRRRTAKSFCIKISTTRSRIDGEWPFLILNFTGKPADENKMLPLRPIFFAHEDRYQITRLIKDLLDRLASCVDLTPVQLWGRIDALMTDAVTKNLKIEDKVSVQLNTTHVPLHFLCKSHICERLDAYNLATVSRLGLKEMIVKREPALKSFLTSNKSVTETALIALLKLVSTEGDGKTVSLSDDFE